MHTELVSGATVDTTTMTVDTISSVFGYILVLSPSGTKELPFTDVHGDSFEYLKRHTLGCRPLKKLRAFDQFNKFSFS
jgi:hypothetical protein